jgi:uncharacterized membrane protein YcaP (DUF421 family)
MTVRWDELIAFTIPPLELVLRGTIVYLGLLLLIAVARNREAGPLGANNMLVLVLMAASTHHALVGESSSVADSAVVVGTILAWSYGIDRLRFRLSFLGAFRLPEPVVLVDHGRILPKNLKRESVTEEELAAQLRLRGIEHVSEVKRAYIESDGQLSVIPFDGPTDGPRRTPSAA